MLIPTPGESWLKTADRGSDLGVDGVLVWEYTGGQAEGKCDIGEVCLGFAYILCANFTLGDMPFREGGKQFYGIQNVSNGAEEEDCPRSARQKEA